MRKCLRLCVFAPEILLRLASVCMGEWVNSVERIACFLVAKDLIFNYAKICVCNAAFASVSCLSRSRHSPLLHLCLFEDCCVFPHCVNRMHSRRMHKRCERRDADTKDVTRTWMWKTRRGHERRDTEVSAQLSALTRTKTFFHSIGTSQTL